MTRQVFFPTDIKKKKMLFKVHETLILKSFGVFFFKFALTYKKCREIFGMLNVRVHLVYLVETDTNVK